MRGPKYNRDMAATLPRPDRDRLSSMIAMVLLAYGLVRVIELPSVEWEFSVLGLFIRLGFDTRTLMVALAGALAATGADWLIRSHPAAASSPPGVEHRVVPGLAALGAGAILIRLPLGLPLALGLGLAAALLAAVFWAEFVVFDPGDRRHIWASLGLRSLSMILLLGAVFTIRSAGLRAIFAIPLIFLACCAIAWRVFKLEGYGERIGILSLTTGWMVAQIAWGLHYLPISATRVALILGTAAYLGLGFALAHRAGRFAWRQVLELAIVGLGSLVIALLLT